MKTKCRYILSVLFYSLLLCPKGTADLDSLFGTTTEDDDTVLYVTIGFFVLSVILMICMALSLYWLYRVIKKRIQKRQEQLAMQEKRQWNPEGGVDDIIDDAHKMVPLPRATNTIERTYENRSYTNESFDFVNSRI